MGRLGYVLSVLAAYLVYLSYLTLFFLCNYYKNKILIISRSLTCFFPSDGKRYQQYFIVCAEFTMGRVCYGLSVLWAEFVMGRDVLEPTLQL